MTPRLALQIYHFGTVNSVELSPDGGMLATVAADWSVKLWESATGFLAQTLRAHTSEVTCAAFSFDGRSLASADTTGVVILWAVSEGMALGSLPDPERYPVSSLALSRDGKVLAVAVGSGGDFRAKIRIWNVETRTLVRTIDEGGEGIARVALSPDASTVWSVGKDGWVRSWDVGTCGPLTSWLAHTGAVSSVSLSPDGTAIASGSADGLVKIWGLDGSLLHEIEGTIDELNEVDFSPSGDMVVIGGPNPKIVDAKTGTLRSILELKARIVRAVRFSMRGDVICGVGDFGDDNSIHGDVLIWDASTGAYLRKLAGHSDIGLTAIVRADERGVLVSANSRGHIIFWSTRTGRRLRTIELPFAVLSLALSPDRKSVAAAGGSPSSGTLAIMRIATRKVIAQLLTASSIRSVVFSDDQRRLAGACEDGSLRIWDASNWEESRNIETGSAGAFSAAFSADGTLVFAGGHDGAVRAFDPETGVLRATLKNQTSRVFALARSADGKLLASGGVNSNFVTIWDLTTLGPPVTTVKNALLAPWALAFVDSGTLVAANANGRVVSIDLVQGSLAAVLVVHELAASALALGRNGLTLWTAGHDYSLSFVDVESAVCKATLCDVNDRLVGSTSGESTEAFLAVDAEGFYNASSGLEDLFRARAAGVLVALTVLRKDFRRPWKIEKALAGV